MALPLAIADFFTVLRDLWGAFPLIVRQIFYLSVIGMGVLGVMKAIH